VSRTLTLNLEALIPALSAFVLAVTGKRVTFDEIDSFPAAISSPSMPPFDQQRRYFPPAAVTRVAASDV
jgi:hypothetical protein